MLKEKILSGKYGGRFQSGVTSVRYMVKAADELYGASIGGIPLMNGFNWCIISEGSQNDALIIAFLVHHIGTPNAMMS
ncbi:hypothetical protein [Bacillus sp. SG-1]|uniref:hypothetical protein n=1 Tax=Bacillus sp. SG-1 TaxID=161544 RepID=UPI0001543AB6|nr:hypothetical protein [Bacillus sp. SG-1]EDL65128.1 hypothetical protein BSG1_05604 [Bacillus sp. SG-1]